MAHLPQTCRHVLRVDPLASNALASPNRRWLHRCLSIAPSMLSALTGQRVMHSQQLPSWKYEATFFGERLRALGKTAGLIV